MQSQLFVQNNGQEVTQADINLLGKTSALADDRTLAGLLRLAPYISGAAKAILPHQAQAVVASAGAAGGVMISPFLAIVGSRSDTSSVPLDNWQDIRSAWFLRPTTPAGNPTFQAIASNASGNPRWDLVYVTMAVDTADASVSRYVKDPNTLVIAPQTIPVTKTSKLTINVVQGTPAGSPTQPALPADSGSNYNIALAYVRVPNGYGGSSTTTTNEIQEVAPIVAVSQAMGTLKAAPANSLNKVGGSLFTHIPWPASGNRPGPYLPPGMTGIESRFFGLQLMTGQTASHATGDVVDDTTDWRYRLFRWSVHAVPNNSAIKLAYDPSVITSSVTVPSSGGSRVTSQYQFGMGQSFINEGQSDPYVVLLTTTILPAQPTGTLAIYCDMATGALKVFISGAVNMNYFIWLDASQQFFNK